MTREKPEELLVTFIERAAELLSGVDGLHWKQLLASPCVGALGAGPSARGT